MRQTIYFHSFGRSNTFSVAAARLLRPHLRPASQSIGTPQLHPKTSKGPSRKLRTSAYVLLLGGAIFIWDNTYNAETLQRTFRTAYTGALIAADFKLNFNANNAEGIAALHQRVADRLYYMCTKNAGLYIKLGQSIGMQAAVLPKPYREAFANIFDAAPPVEFSELEKVFQQEFQKSPEELFDTFDRRPIATASIAQVHRATLNGKEYAVKIQKPAIPKQLEYDLGAYRALMWCYEKAFNMPVYFVAQYVTDQIRKETDFIHEAHNAEKTAHFLDKEPTLRDKVIVPKILWEYTTARIMTAEYMPGIRITDRDRLDGVGLSLKETMDTALAMSSAMIFKWGWIHCDIHPGNVLVRPHPDRPKKPQIILLDHGLYIPLEEDFRRQYCQFWRALFVFDMKTIDQIVTGWGIGNSELMASATLLRPFKMRKAKSKASAPQKSDFEAQVDVKERLKNMLQNEELIPRELLFIARMMRMAQANNQSLGSPSNRVSILAHWAVSGLDDTTSARRRWWELKALAHDKLQVLTFSVTLLLIDFGFLVTKIRQIYIRLVKGKDEGFEDLLQKQITALAKDEFGIELDGGFYFSPLPGTYKFLNVERRIQMLPFRDSLSQKAPSYHN